MITYIEKRQNSLPYRILSAIIAFTFIFSLVLPPGYAQLVPQTLLNLPAPGAMVAPSAAFMPALINGITIHPENPLQFDFIVNTGDSKLEGKELTKEANKLIKYFLAALTVPEKELWVNLSPYEKDRIIPQGFGNTEMGRDLLAQDYILKQLTASLMYPEKELGKKFWDKIYKQAREKYGTTEIPVNTFNKVWIVPEDAVIYEQDNSAFVVKSHLKVMLEDDYEAQKQDAGSLMLDTSRKSGIQKPASSIETSIIKEVILPAIEKEVNEGENFANLRQIYNSTILATWYKMTLKESLLDRVYVDRNKTKGIDIEDKQVNEKIYSQYLEAFRKGVYNYIKEDYDEATQEVIPRKYFSGGADLTLTEATNVNAKPAMSRLRRGVNGVLVMLALGGNLAGGISSTNAEDMIASGLKGPGGSSYVQVTANLQEFGPQAKEDDFKKLSEQIAAGAVLNPPVSAQAGDDLGEEWWWVEEGLRQQERHGKIYERLVVLSTAEIIYVIKQEGYPTLGVGADILAKRKDPAAVKPLIELYREYLPTEAWQKEGPFYARADLVSAIGRIGGDEAKRFLQETVKNDPSPTVRDVAKQKLSRPSARSIAGEDDWGQRQEKQYQKTYERLAVLSSAELINVIRQEGYPTLGVGANILAERKDPSAVKPLIELYRQYLPTQGQKEGPLYARADLVSAIGRIGGDEAKRFLQEAVKNDPSPMVRDVAKQQLLRLSSEPASSPVGKDNEQGRGVGERGQEKPVILLVDDEERWRESYKEWLSGSYEIIEASDGQEALKKIKSEEGVRIGLVFSDQNMRRMNGNVLAGIIKKDFPNLPVIIATATSDEDFRTYEQGLKEGLPNVVTVLDKETMVQGMVLKAVQQALEDSGSPASSLVEARDLYRDFYDSFGAKNKTDGAITGKDVGAFSQAFLSPDAQLLPYESRRNNGTLGVTEVNFLEDSATRRRMTAFQQQLKAAFGDKVYLVDSDKLHFTIQGLETQWDDKDAGTKKELAMHSGLEAIDMGRGVISEVRERARNIVTPSFKMQVAGLNWNPRTGIFWELRPYLADSQEDPVMQRRKAWDLPQPRPPHVTAAYFTQEFNPEDMTKLRQLVAQYQNSDYFGDIAVNNVEVIAYTDFSFNAGYKVLENVPLTASLPSDEARMSEERVEGIFDDVQSVWDKIVDLYQSSPQRENHYLVVIPLNTYLNKPLGEQYSFKPGDVIVPGAANPIDHGGWAPISVGKDNIHSNLRWSTMDLPKGTTYRLFVDTLDSGIKVAKIVIVKPGETLSSPVSQETIDRVVKWVDEAYPLSTTGKNALKSAIQDKKEPGQIPHISFLKNSPKASREEVGVVFAAAIVAMMYDFPNKEAVIAVKKLLSKELLETAFIRDLNLSYEVLHPTDGAVKQVLTSEKVGGIMMRAYLLREMFLETEEDTAEGKGGLTSSPMSAERRKMVSRYLQDLSLALTVHEREALSAPGLIGQIDKYTEEDDVFQDNLDVLLDVGKAISRGEMRFDHETTALSPLIFQNSPVNSFAIIQELAFLNAAVIATKDQDTIKNRLGLYKWVIKNELSAEIPGAFALIKDFVDARNRLSLNDIKTLQQEILGNNPPASLPEADLEKLARRLDVAPKDVDGVLEEYVRAVGEIVERIPVLLSSKEKKAIDLFTDPLRPEDVIISFIYNPEYTSKERINELRGDARKKMVEGSGLGISVDGVGPVADFFRGEKGLENLYGKTVAEDLRGDIRLLRELLGTGLPGLTLTRGRISEKTEIRRVIIDTILAASSPVKITSVGTEDKEFLDRVWEMFEKGDVHGKGEGAKRVEEFLGKAKRTIRAEGETRYTIGDVLYLSYTPEDEKLRDDEDLFFEPEIAQSVPTVSIRADKKRLFLAMAGDPSVVLDIVLEEAGAIEAQFISSDKFREIVRAANSYSSPVVVTKQDVRTWGGFDDLKIDETIKITVKPSGKNLKKRVPVAEVGHIKQTVPSSSQYRLKQELTNDVYIVELKSGTGKNNLLFNIGSDTDGLSWISVFRSNDGENYEFVSKNDNKSQAINVTEAMKTLTFRVFEGEKRIEVVVSQRWFDLLTAIKGRKLITDAELETLNGYRFEFKLASSPVGENRGQGIGDRVQEISTEAPGGIDLNPALLDLQIKRDGNGVPLPLPQQPIENMHIEGFLPIIINVTPITTLPMLLGLADTEQDADEIMPGMKARDPEEISALN